MGRKQQIFCSQTFKRKNSFIFRPFCIITVAVCSKTATLPLDSKKKKKNYAAAVLYSYRITLKKKIKNVVSFYYI